MELKNKKILIISLVVIFLLIAGGVAAFMVLINGDNASNLNTNTALADENTNLADNINSDTNVNAPPSVAVNTEVTIQGRVFIKGYDTPSESFGILSVDGNEIGLEKYDSRREEFRPYINEQVSVTFSSVCRGNASACCRTLFYYCGTIKSWEPLTE